MREAGSIRTNGNVNNLHRFRWPAAFLSARFVLTAGAILMFIGICESIGAFGTSQVLNLPDPIFGVTIRKLMMVMAFANLASAALCLFGRQNRMALALITWLALNYLAYYIGLYSTSGHYFEFFPIQPLGFSLYLTGLFVGVSMIYLLIGGGVHVLAGISQLAASGRGGTIYKNVLPNLWRTH